MSNDRLRKNCLLCITAGKWQVNSIKEAQKLGLKICAIDSDKNAQGLKVADYFICEELDQIEKIIKKIEKLQINVKGVVCFNSDAGVLAASLLREHYKVSGMKSFCAKVFVSKSLQKKNWLLNGIKTPKYYEVRTYDQFIKTVMEMKIPFIIKPVDSAGSRGISVINNTKIKNFDKFFEKAMNESKEKVIIIEDFIKGVEYVVDVLAVGNEIISLGLVEKKKVKNTNNTVAMSLQTTNLSYSKIKHIKNYVSRAFSVLGLEDCAGHAELIIDNKGKIWMIEVAARGGGFLVFDKLVPMMSGINLPAEVAKLALGLRDKNLKILSNNVLLYFFPSKKGTVKQITGFNDVLKIQNIEGQSFVSIEDKVRKVSSDGDRLGYLFAWGDNIRILEDKIRKAKKLIKFIII